MIKHPQTFPTFPLTRLVQTLIGALTGGWLGDRYGRITTLGFGCIWTIFGAILQASAQNADWMFCGKGSHQQQPVARLLTSHFSTSHQRFRNWHLNGDHTSMGNRDCVSPLAGRLWYAIHIYFVNTHNIIFLTNTVAMEFTLNIFGVVVAYWLE